MLVLLAGANNVLSKKITKMKVVHPRTKQVHKQIYIWNSPCIQGVKFNRAVSLTYDNFDGSLSLEVTDFGFHGNTIDNNIYEDDAESTLQGQYVLLTKIKYWMMQNSHKVCQEELLALHNYIAFSQETINEIIGDNELITD